MINRWLDSKYFNILHLNLYLFFCSFFVLYLNIENLPFLYFDELHYVPAAKQWLDWVPDRNIEHPPLGKLILAGSIKIFGDNFFSWRIFSVLSGCYSIMFIFNLAMRLFRSRSLAILVALLSLFNFWIFVQSRIAMLEIYMLCFFLGALWSYFAGYFKTSAALWGLAIAIKWSILLFFVPFIIFYLWKLIKVPDSNSNLKTNYWAVLCRFFDRQVLGSFGGFILIVAAVYFITFIPYVFVENSERLKWYEIITHMPNKMYQLQKTVGGSHPYESKWYTWIFMVRPIWYEFTYNIEQIYFRGVVMLGNPLVMLAGFISILMLAWRWERLILEMKFFILLFLISYISWGIVPRKITYFYYFLPNAILYSFLIPMALLNYFELKKVKLIMLGLVIGSLFLFLYFYPVLTGQLNLNKFMTKWYWFNSWI